MNAAAAFKPGKKRPWFPLVVFRCTIGYATFFCSHFGFIVLALPFFAVCALIPGLQKKIMRLTLHWYLVFLTQFWLPFLRVYRIAPVQGFSEPLPRPCIYVANHRGRLDALLLLSLLDKTGVLIKSKYTTQPLYAALVRFFDFVSINASSLQSLETARARLNELFNKKISLLLFPEGTRAPGSRLANFKDFAFRLAIEFNLPVVPIVIHSELPFMARIKGSIFPRFTFTYTVHALQAQQALPGEAAGQFCDRIQKLVSNRVKELDRNTIWEQL